MENKNQMLNDSELIENFVLCAKEQEKALLGGSTREYTRYFNRMKALDEVFRARGHTVQSMLLPFLNDHNEGVRYWSAKRLFIVDPIKSRATMEQLAKDMWSPIGAEARSTLSRIDSGQFNPDDLWAPTEQG